MLGGRFMATKIETSEALPKKMSGLTGFFQSRVSEIQKPSDATRSLKPKDSSVKEQESAPENPPSNESSPEDPNKEIES